MGAGEGQSHPQAPVPAPVGEGLAALDHRSPGILTLKMKVVFLHPIETMQLVPFT